MQHSNPVKKLLSFLSPSIAGVMLYIIVYVLIIAQRILASYHSLFNSLRINQFNGTWVYRAGGDVNRFFSLDSVGKVGLFVLWLLLGLLVYGLVTFLGRNAKTLATGVSEAEGHYLMPRKANRFGELIQFFAGFTIRAVTLITIFFYTRYVIHVYTTWLQPPNIYHSLSGKTLIDAVEVFIEVVLLLHIFVLLLRLVMLRTRVFISH